VTYIFKKRDTGRGGVNWIELAQEWSKWGTLINKVMNLQVPKNSVNFLTSLGAVSFSKMILRHGVC
jgi:hypothetical protein